MRLSCKDCPVDFLGEGYLESYLKDEISEEDFREEGSLGEESLGSTNICFGPEGGRGGLTGRWLGNY